MGLSVSDAVRVFLTRVAADKQLPFDLKVPNAETRASMAEVDEMLSTRRARFATAEDLFDDLAKMPKSASSKRTNLRRASDYSKSFRKDWERLAPALYGNV